LIKKTLLRIKRILDAFKRHNSNSAKNEEKIEKRYLMSIKVFKWI